MILPGTCIFFTEEDSEGGGTYEWADPCVLDGLVGMREELALERMVVGGG